MRAQEEIFFWAGEPLGHFCIPILAVEMAVSPKKFPFLFQEEFPVVLPGAADRQPRERVHPPCPSQLSSTMVCSNRR